MIMSVVNTLGDLHQPVWFRSRNGVQQHCVHHAKDGGIRPDPEREREHGHGGEAGVLQQLAQGEFQIVHGAWSAGQIPKSQTPSAKEIPSIKFQTMLRRPPSGDSDWGLIRFWGFGIWCCRS